MENIREAIEQRTRQNEQLFYVELKHVSSEYGYDVVKRKKCYGISKGDNIVVEPIYDEVTLCPNDLAVLKIENKCACLNTKTQQLILDFEYLKIVHTDGFLKLYCSQGKRYGIYDLENERMLATCGQYEDFNLKVNYTEYLWARRGKYFDYIHRSTGRVVRLPAVTMAYDTQTGMFGKDKYDVVAVYDANGYADSSRLRTLVQQAGGYLTLDNFTYHEQHVIDINGNILNI